MPISAALVVLAMLALLALLAMIACCMRAPKQDTSKARFLEMWEDWTNANTNNQSFADYLRDHSNDTDCQNFLDFLQELKTWKSR